MLKVLLQSVILAASVSVSVAGSQAVVSKHKTASPPTADVLNEDFTDTVGGYRTAGWSEAITAACGTCINDEDETAACPATTGWAGNCFEQSVGGSGLKAYAEWDAGSAQTGPRYFTIHFRLISLSAFDGQDQFIFTVDSQNAVDPSASLAAISAYIVYYVDNVSDPEAVDCGAYPCRRLYMRIGGETTVPQVELLTGTNHNLRFFVQPGSATGSITLDGTVLATGLDSEKQELGHGNWQYIRMGIARTSGGATQIVWDDINVSTTGYVD